ncbi:hypothetical protein D3C87_1521480 [compost metagenome]
MNAVQFEQPIIQNSEISPYLTNLAGKCLLKDWRVRLSLINWADFTARQEKAAPHSSAKQRVANRSSLLVAQANQNVNKKPKVPRKSEIITAAIEHLKVTVRAIRSENDLLPRVQVSRLTASGNQLLVKYEPSDAVGLKDPLQITVSVEVVEAISNAVQLSAVAFLGGKHQPDMSPDAVDLFSGVFNAAGVREALEEYIYRVLEKAQDNEKGSALWLPVSMEE